MNAKNDSHANKKYTLTRKESSVSICDTPTGFISNRKKRKITVNTLNDINNTPTLIDVGTSTRNKQTKSKTKIKGNKVTSSITETSNNISMKSTDETSKKRKLYSSKDKPEFKKQNDVENINCKPNKPVGDHTIISNTDAFDRLKMMSPYPEENVNSDYTMKLRSRRAKVFNFSSDTDEDNDYYLNNSKFANRIRQKSTIKKSSVKQPKTVVKKLQPIRKPLQRKCNNPLIDERVRESHMEVLDTSITYKDNDELIEANPKPHHVYPEVTIVYPTTDMNKSCTSVTSLNIEVEEPNVSNSLSDNFLTKIKNIFKTNDTNGTDKFQTNIVSSPHEIVDICDVEQEQSIQDEHSPKQHNENESNKETPVDHSINPTVLTSYDEIVSLEQVQCLGSKDCTSSRYLQSENMKSKSQKTNKGNTEQKYLPKKHKRHNSVQDMAQLRIFNDRSSGDFQAKSKVKTLKNRDTKQLSKGKDTQKIVQISKHVDGSQTSKYDEVTIVQPIETYNSLMTSEKSNRSKQTPIPESKVNANTDNLNWEEFLDPDIQCINTNGQQPSRSRNTSTPNIYLIESQESQHNYARASEHSTQEQPSTSILNNNENRFSQSLVVKPGLLQNYHIEHDVQELSAQSSIHNEASQGDMLNISEHSRTEEQNEAIIKLLKDIKEQNEKFLADVEKDTESLLDLLLLYDTKIFKKYIAECEKQKNVIIAKLKTNLRNSLEENNESFNKLEQFFKK